MLKLETSNLAQKWMAMSTKENAKLGQMWSRGGLLTHFLEFWDPLISPGRMKLEISNLSHKWMAVSTNEK